jgi:hypothetical protein
MPAETQFPIQSRCVIANGHPSGRSGTHLTVSARAADQYHACGVDACADIAVAAIAATITAAMIPFFMW